MNLHMGLDVGSTTVKIVITDDDFNTLYSVYRRHKSDVKQTVATVLKEAYEQFKNDFVTVNVTGSGGMFVEKYLGIDFVQEVIAETKAIKKFIPETDVVIELGGEDSKITYLKGSVEQRMNSICAGGTGAFIDQMAALLDTDASGLNDLSKDYKKIYPIASRCGVFAKTDIQALMNQGASREDIAISVFQSVVNQTISNLACGRPIKGNVTFLGGPLHFLKALRDRFIETLGEEENTFFTPVDAQLYVAKGAAIMSAEESEPISYKSLIKSLEEDKDIDMEMTKSLDRLFKSEDEYEEFKKEHKTDLVKYRKIEDYDGEIYLGIDAGSTTSKLVMISEDNEILHDDYQMNLGRPLEVVIGMLKKAYKKMSNKAKIVSSGICGYGEEFIRNALHIDNGEVETIAHYSAAKFFNPEVDFILDIGGQDMKAMHIRDGIIDSIQLNESCSSGCGSFLSTFAASVGLSVEEFQKKALFAKKPADLGSRCTVFMNSKVKQAQKEGSEVSDIAAGLCYSVIKNAIQKVIKVRDPKSLGKNIVVQGGTFYGDAILRAFEKLSTRKVTRPEISGLMGAMGMALLSKEKSTGHSKILSLEEIDNFTYTQKSARCGRCTNNCSLQINIFPDGSRYITGNRCERGAGVKQEETLADLNMYKFKNKLLFDRKTLGDKNILGRVGIPRVLNMYEDYPFWHEFFTSLGFDVVLSDESTREIYEKGIATISSETACYPAKISHGHIESLIEKDLDMIFYPAVFYEYKQFDKAQNHMNCPVVSGYPDLIENNVDNLSKTKYMAPYLSFESEKIISDRLVEIFEGYEHNGYKLTRKQIINAVKNAWAKEGQYHEDIRKKGREILEYVHLNNEKAIVLAGRPYHIDPEINHGIPELIESMRIPVLSEDAIAYSIEDLKYETRVLDQWSYHARLYRAAEFVANDPCLQLVQLNSFGCGLDAVTTDQVQEILESRGKIYTLLKIDEVSNLGAVKIRIRSLVQALEQQKGREDLKENLDDDIKLYESHEFTKEMKNDGYTILAPQMAREHFEIMESLLNGYGYNIEFLDKVDSNVIDNGLKYVNNDSCYPSITVVGQFMEAIKSGRYDTDKLALLMTQTGGACRASNYVGYIRKALKDAGYPQIPVIALSAQGIESHSGFDLKKVSSIPMLINIVRSLLLGDLINRVSNATRPYEKNKGEVNSLKLRWIGEACDKIFGMSSKTYKKMIQDIVNDFDEVEVLDIKKPKAGIVGEILVKYLEEANNHLQDTLEDEGAQVIVPDLTDFLMYCLANTEIKKDLYGKSPLTAFFGKAAINTIEFYRKPIRRALKNSKRFEEPVYINDVKEYAKEVTSLGNQAGEGWLLAGEMVELIHQDAPNIVCIQPFGCLPNHITGKGVMKKIREIYPKANIVAIDYDPGASEVNQINRVKLMMSQARENLKEEGAKV
ncbi:2-hydroxyacyl-CoA dehydratase [Anaerococcus porci]|uniref:2-hydroxyacyl-CoA dehydratase n=1 Tax=Anaerococcus porci TaxID=2652269 RepID=A0A6N7VF20_9FIRM|nr:2-hydroxyacyl-CoA dehydratase [Anaerococcus porci]MDY3005905.1 acyl-CoA dehydratase activase-related protein [Anaerococcus porci]MSS78030.1 2-hydroxyacyl-CoA dehydratase [Anaerococcus porci]